MEGALQALEASGSAVAMIDRSARSCASTAARNACLARTWTAVRRRILSADRDATAALDRALHALLWSRESEAPRAPRSAPSARAAHHRLSVAPSGRRARGFRALRGICPSFVDLEARQRPVMSHLMRAFGLTQTEEELECFRPAEGRSLEEIAEQRQTSMTTVRSQLKAVFAKTGTHRQSELVALLGKLAGPRR